MIINRSGHTIARRPHLLLRDTGLYHRPRKLLLLLPLLMWLQALSRDRMAWTTLNSDWRDNASSLTSQDKVGLLSLLLCAFHSHHLRSQDANFRTAPEYPTNCRLVTRRPLAFEKKNFNERTDDEEREVCWRLHTSGIFCCRVELAVWVSVCVHLNFS